jgi:hypothetical protein
MSLTGTGAVASVAQKADDSKLSPFAQMMSDLQQLQQSDPAKYKQVTQDIATNLQSAAQTATASGDTKTASQLNQLAGDFSTASASGQLPNVQDLAQAMGGHHHHHHHAAAPTDNTSTDNTSSSSAIQSLSDLLTAHQSSTQQPSATDAMSIIMGTLSSSSTSAI